MHEHLHRLITAEAKTQEDMELLNDLLLSALDRDNWASRPGNDVLTDMLRMAQLNASALSRSHVILHDLGMAIDSMHAGQTDLPLPDARAAASQGGADQ